MDDELRRLALRLIRKIETSDYCSLDLTLDLKEDKAYLDLKNYLEALNSKAEKDKKSGPAL